MATSIKGDIRQRNMSTSLSIRQVIINKDLKERNGQTYMNSVTSRVLLGLIIEVLGRKMGHHRLHCSQLSRSSITE